MMMMMQVIPETKKSLPTARQLRRKKTNFVWLRGPFYLERLATPTVMTLKADIATMSLQVTTFITNVVFDTLIEAVWFSNKESHEIG